MIEARFQLEQVADKVEQQYFSAIAKRKHPAHIPVLMYHKVVKAPLPSKHRIFVTTETFEQHLTFLRNRGAVPINFLQYEAFRSGKRPWSEFPENPVFLTFDDAYLNNLENAVPLLKRFGFTATIFALGSDSARTNFWDSAEGEPQEPLMTAAQLLEAQNSGIEIGAHSLTHRHLTRLNDSEAMEEILHSKQNLEATLGRPVISFATPTEAGTRACATWWRLLATGLRSAPTPARSTWKTIHFTIFRVSVFPEDGPSQLRKKISSWYRRYYKLKRGK